MKTFYMHHYLCIVQCVDEKKKIRCTLLNINAKQRNAKIKKKNTNNIFLSGLKFYLGLVCGRSVFFLCVCAQISSLSTCQFSKILLI